MVERFVRNEEARGSNPLTSTTSVLEPCVVFGKKPPDDFASREDLPDRASLHIRQPKIAARMAVSETLVVEAEAMQHRGMQVVDGRAILDGAE